MTTTPIPTIVTILNKNKIPINEIIIPDHAPAWLMEAANKTLTWIGSGAAGERYSDLGIPAIWASFSALTNIY